LPLTKAQSDILVPKYPKKLMDMTLFAGQELGFQTSLSDMTDQEIKNIKVISDVELAMPFAQFSNNSRLITFSPRMKDIGEYHASLTLKNIIIGD
jgi:hypothetical protein